MHEFQNLHLVYKEKINEFVMAHFFPSYTFDLDRTLYFFIDRPLRVPQQGLRPGDRGPGAAQRPDPRRRASTARSSSSSSRSGRSGRSTPRSCGGGPSWRRCGTPASPSRTQFGDRLFEATAMGEAPPLDDLVDDFWRLRLRRMRTGLEDQPPAARRHPRPGGRGQRRGPQPVPLRAISGTPPTTRSRSSTTRTSSRRRTRCSAWITTSSSAGATWASSRSYYEPWGYTPLECVAAACRR